MTGVGHEVYKLSTLSMLEAGFYLQHRKGVDLSTPYWCEKGGILIPFEPWKGNVLIPSKGGRWTGYRHINLLIENCIDYMFNTHTVCVHSPTHNMTDRLLESW